MKTKIDKFFTENYAQLVGIASARIKRYSRIVEAETVVSNAYVYILSKSKDLKESDIPIWATAYINLEISMPKSVTNQRANKFNSGHECINDCEYFENTDIYKDIDIKNIFESFRTTLDRVDQIILDVYLEKGMDTKRAMAEHFKIDSSSALIYINRIKEKLKNYVGS
jgi:hypothetical protein